MTHQSASFAISKSVILASIAAAGLAACVAPAPATAPPTSIVRTAVDDPRFPIAKAVSVPASYDIVFISGMLPKVADPTAPKGTVASYGDIQTQTDSVLKQLGDALHAQGLGFGDVVAAHVFMAPDPSKNGDIDFAGMNAVFNRYFGSVDQPNKPARAAMKVAALVAPGTLVEIELTAARAPK